MNDGSLFVARVAPDSLGESLEGLASDERLAQASTGAVAIVAVSLVPVAILSWMVARARPGGSRA